VPDRPRPPTLRDVARLATVDPSVVSRLVNNRPDLSISDDTRARVVVAIEELGYQPNLTARGLRLQHTYAVGFVLPQLENPVYAPIVRGVDRAAQAAGFGLVLGDATGEVDTERTFVRLLREGRVDGLLIASTALSDAFLRARGGPDVPLVVVNRRVEGVAACVTLEDEAGSAIAAEHLLGLGHRDLAVVTGPLRVDSSRRRLEGFQRACAEAGATVTVREAPTFSAPDGYAAARALLAEAAPTALFAATLTLALGVLRAGHEHGLRLPADLSVIALHDAPLADYTHPRLTTVAMPLEGLGAEAFRTLEAQMAGRMVQPTVVRSPEPVLRVRASTAAVGDGA
jgi:LacI family transcriptional regulator